jgi:hypothetical protein
VFERFHRIEVARTYEGTGIGLAFVRLGVESIYLNRRGSRNRDSALDRWPILSTRSIEAATLLRQMSLRVVTPFCGRSVNSIGRQQCHCGCAGRAQRIRPEIV